MIALFPVSIAPFASEYGTPAFPLDKTAALLSPIAFKNNPAFILFRDRSPPLLL